MTIQIMVAKEAFLSGHHILFVILTQSLINRNSTNTADFHYALLAASRVKGHKKRKVLSCGMLQVVHDGSRLYSQALIYRNSRKHVFYFLNIRGYRHGIWSLLHDKIQRCDIFFHQSDHLPDCEYLHYIWLPLEAQHICYSHSRLPRAELCSHSKK